MPDIQQDALTQLCLKAAQKALQGEVTAEAIATVLSQELREALGTRRANPRTKNKPTKQSSSRTQLVELLRKEQAERQNPLGHRATR